MKLEESLKKSLKHGMKVKARLGRIRHDDTEWSSVGTYILHVQFCKNEPILISIQNQSWAEYDIRTDYVGNNLFQAEDYLIEIMDWFYQESEMRNIPIGTSIMARIGGLETRCIIQKDTGEGYLVTLPYLYHQSHYYNRQIAYADVVELED